jgi:tRNA-binding EMAP/Myf-like protein
MTSQQSYVQHLLPPGRLLTAALFTEAEMRLFSSQTLVLCALTHGTRGEVLRRVSKSSQKLISGSSMSAGQ